METGYVAPAGHVLTDRYLAGEIAGKPVVSSFIYHADVYSAVPDVLVSGRQLVRDGDHNDACYIISAVRYAGTKKNRKLRRIDGDPRKSCWHSEKGKVPLEGSKNGGYVQDFVHAIKGTDGRIERLGWRMKEYGLSTEEHGDSDLVLCKLYRTPRDREPTTTASTSATSATPAHEVPDVYSDPVIDSKKRKAADGDYPEDSTPSSARPRLIEEHPPIAMRSEPESIDVEDPMYCEAMIDERIRFRAAIPNAPDPMEDLEGYMKCYDEYVMNIAAEAVRKNAAQPEPEREDHSFFQSMEQEFPSLIPSMAPEPRSAHDQLFKVCMTESIRAAMPNAPDPEEDLDGYMKCLEELVMEARQELINEGAQQPEPEWDMEHEFPFLY
ncbi:hypothetical protein ACQ4PT_032935 [Festuca glaucescens]